MRRLIWAALLWASTAAYAATDARGHLIYNSTIGVGGTYSCSALNSQKQFYAETNRIRASAGVPLITSPAEPFLRTWILGYLSAANQYQTPDFLKKTNETEIMAAIDAYCQKYVSRSLRDAADAFSLEMIKKP